MQFFTGCMTALVIMAGVMVSTVSAEITTKLSGDVLYRWQYDYVKEYDNEGVDTGKTGDFTNKYWWNLRMAVTANENLAFNVRLSNPSGYMTDNVSTNLFRAGMFSINNFVTVPELCFKWNYSIVNLSGGIISVGMPPVTNTVLDLVAFETTEVSQPEFIHPVRKVAIEKDSVTNNGYQNVGLMPWFVATNGSQIGLDLGFNFYKTDPLAIRLNVIGTIASDLAKADAADAIKRDQLRFIFMVPVDLMGKKISVTPTMHIRTNVYRSADLEEGNHSIAAGLDVAAKPVDMIGAKAGFAIGGYNNSSLKKDPDSATTAPLGMLINAGVSVAPGFGKASVDFAFGSWKDRELDSKPFTETVVDVKSNTLLYWDIIYDMPVKSLVIRPRLRIWKTLNDMDDSGKLQLRPEIDFIAKF
jgi:hypothetical protein